MKIKSSVVGSATICGCVLCCCVDDGVLSMITSCSNPGPVVAVVNWLPMAVCSVFSAVDAAVAVCQVVGTPSLLLLLSVLPKMTSMSLRYWNSSTVGMMRGLVLSQDAEI